MTFTLNKSIAFLVIGVLFLSLQLAPMLGLPTVALDLFSLESKAFPPYSKEGDLRCSLDYKSIKFGWPFSVYEIAGSSTCPVYVYYIFGLVINLIIFSVVYRIFLYVRR